jgi:hypothetical protein
VIYPQYVADGTCEIKSNTSGRRVRCMVRVCFGIGIGRGSYKDLDNRQLEEDNNAMVVPNWWF